MSATATISIGEWKLIQSTGQLRTCGLGSCVGVVLYDPLQKIAGMVHIMLPDSSKARKGKVNPYRYADTALISLSNQLKAKGAGLLKAKVAGGAQMFRYAVKQEFMQIGERNVEAVKLVLKQLGIPIISECVGGSSGRTIEFQLETNDLIIRTVHQNEIII
ncbi:chemotaxis protein CheD [Bacillus sp. JCM 19046]|uniref:Probable chemoreceptor glutamine deamidase CheD n=1 Tax=Shouchella xiaoxiensis TaxID=766895 RepID=A0ABS2SRL8_9BACI|nr:chemotaxis protein CheD [Shouchella xiaoxiensis]MBM7837671.1 chemotaxis protein CheD [Shouchella xiaoxiensis]GAF12902.1 chemotaxis protein CheD [Bacillus sp. JCM 19045]GAF16728.1 chemotaxis protein CheD [Bacillus sp. JCM 19046]